MARPELLLCYDMYLLFKSHLIDEDYITVDRSFSEKEFLNLSKEAWTDLLLKIYKTFVFDRILSPLQTNDLYSDQFMEHFEHHLEELSDDFNKNEAKLILWVDYHYQKEKDNILPGIPGPQKEIRQYLQIFDDCLPLITLIISYCPYTQKNFKEVYFDVTDKAKRFSNLCTVIRVWKKLNFSFNLRSIYTFDYSDLEILMLLTYLYEVLPDLYPSETITIMSNVGEKTTHNLLLKNPSPVPIAYTVIIFGNERQEFQIEKNVITIHAKSQAICKIIYTAKTIVKTSAVIILSGDTKGQKYARSKTYNINGIPDIFYHINEFAFEVPLYMPYSKDIEITSPYGKDYYANTYLTNINKLKEIDKPENFEDFLSMAELKKERTPRQINFNEICSFDENGICTLNLQLCLVTCSKKKYLIYFLNEDIGVFCVQIVVQGILNIDLTEKIGARLPPKFDFKEKCKCRSTVINAMCPLVIHIPIPCRNDNLMRGFRQMFETFAEECEINFWNEYLGRFKNRRKDLINMGLKKCSFQYTR